jgi:hypothetical protein
MAARHEDSAVSRVAGHSAPHGSPHVSSHLSTQTASLDLSAGRTPSPEIVSFDGIKPALLAPPSLTRAQSGRLWEEAVQPLTAVVARAEVIRELIEGDELAEVAVQLVQVEENLQRLLAQVALMRAAMAPRTLPPR